MAAGPITEERAEEADVELREIRKLAALPGWSRYFAGYLARKAGDHLAGVSSIALTPEKRAEHIQAYHLALELPGWADKRIGELEDLLRKYRQQAD